MMKSFPFDRMLNTRIGYEIESLYNDETHSVKGNPNYRNGKINVDMNNGFGAQHFMEQAPTPPPDSDSDTEPWPFSISGDEELTSTQTILTGSGFCANITENQDIQSSHSSQFHFNERRSQDQVKSNTKKAEQWEFSGQPIQGLQNLEHTSPISFFGIAVTGMTSTQWSVSKSSSEELSLQAKPTSTLEAHTMMSSRPLLDHDYCYTAFLTSQQLGQPAVETSDQM